MVELNALAGWHRAPCIGGMVMQSPDGWTRVRIRPRMVTLRAPRELVEEVSREVFGGAVRVVHTSVTSLVTNEGELGAIASAQLTVSGRATDCSVAIAGDEPYMCIDVIGPRSCEYAGTLIQSLGLGCGAARRRWFPYAPPPRWLGSRRPGRVVWLHPEYPRVLARITVFDARPFQSTLAERLDRFLFARMEDGFAAVGPQLLEDITSEHGLSGRVRVILGTMGDQPMLRIASAMADDRFSYLAHFEGPPEGCGERTFRDMLASFCSLPAPGAVALTALYAD